MESPHYRKWQVLLTIFQRSYPPHSAPGNPKPYLRYKLKLQYQVVYNAISEQLKRHNFRDILNVESWQVDHNAVDKLFESVNQAMKNEREDMKILKHPPFFDDFVEQAVEEYLATVIDKGLEIVFLCCVTSAHSLSTRLFKTFGRWCLLVWAILCIATLIESESLE